MLKVLAEPILTGTAYRVLFSMESHSVLLPATRNKWTHPTLTPPRQAGTRITYPGEMEGWVDLGEWLHAEMIQSPKTCHPSK